MPEVDLVRKFKERSLLKTLFPYAVYDPAKGKEQITDYSRKQMEVSTNEAGFPVDNLGHQITEQTSSGIERSVDVLTDPDVEKIRPLHGDDGGSVVIYKDGTQVEIPKDKGGGYLYYSSPDLKTIKPGGTGSNAIFVFGDGTESVANTIDAEKTSGNFFESGNWGPYLIGAVAAAIAVYGAVVAGPLMAGEGAAAGGTVATGATGAGAAAGSIGTATGLTAAEMVAAGATAADMAAYGFTAAEIAAAAGGTVATGGLAGTTGAGPTGGTPAPVGTGGTTGALTVTELIQNGATAADLVTATDGALTLAQANALIKGAADGWSAIQILNAANAALTTGATIAAMVNSGDKTVSTTTTTTPVGAGGNVIVPPVGGGAGGTTVTTTPTGTVIAGKDAKTLSFEDYINDFYGLTGGKSVSDRIGENVIGQKAAETTFTTGLSALDQQRLTDTKAAIGPFQQQLTGALADADKKTGYFTPFEYSFGGKKMPSFVPKQQFTEMEKALGLGREKAQVDTGIVDQGYNANAKALATALQFAAAHPTNEAADTYSAKIGEAMKYFNPNGTTSTTTGNVPGIPWYTTLLQGLNTGVNTWKNINGERPTTGYTVEQLNAALALLNGKA